MGRAADFDALGGNRAVSSRARFLEPRYRQGRKHHQSRGSNFGSHRPARAGHRGYTGHPQASRCTDRGDVLHRPQPAARTNRTPRRAGPRPRRRSSYEKRSSQDRPTSWPLAAPFRGEPSRDISARFGAIGCMVRRCEHKTVPTPPTLVTRCAAPPNAHATQIEIRRR